jgi:uncharacterized surface protein with fasciclin (FAS1) repeats
MQTAKTRNPFMTRILASLAAVAALVGPVAAFAQGAAAPAPAAPPAAAAPAAATATIAPAGDLVDTLKASGQFTILLKALDASNLTGVLKTPGPLTILAPTDAAFNALPAGQLDNLMKVENAGQLQTLLVYHLINAGVAPAKVNGSKGPIRNAANADLQFDGTGPVLTIADAKVVAEGSAANGFIYAIDKVLGPAPAPAAQ